MLFSLTSAGETATFGSAVIGVSSVGGRLIEHCCRP
jgi:hypothetical protein